LAKGCRGIPSLWGYREKIFKINKRKRRHMKNHLLYDIIKGII
jgi:hypothetical protein